MRFFVAVILAFVAVLLIQGCDDKVQCRGIYHFHESFPHEWRDLAREGISKWNAFGLEKVAIVDGDESDRTCSFEVVAEDSAEYKAQIPKDGSSWAGISNGYNGAIAMCPDHWGPREETDTEWKSPFWFRDGTLEVQHITMHEIGHVYGLEHTLGHGIMNAYDFVRCDVEYRQSDLEECIRVGSCDVKSASRQP